MNDMLRLKPLDEVTEPGPEPVEAPRITERAQAWEPKWSLGFLAMLAYLFVEYMRLSAQYQFLLPLQIGKIVVAVGLLGWILSPRLLARSPAVSFVDLVMILFNVVAVASACIASYQVAAWDEIMLIVRWLAIYFLISRIIVSRWRLRVFISLLLLLNLKMAQFAIRNFGALKSAGVAAESLAKVGVGAGSVGFFGNAGDFGVAMCVVWPLAGILLLAEKKFLPRFFLLACFLGFSGAIVVCGSRGAVVGAVAAALAAWARNPRKLGAAVLFLLFVPALYYILPDASKARFESARHYQTDSTARSRLQFWSAGLRMFHDHPFMGVGPGNFPLEYERKYSKPGDEPGTWSPHSIYIEALSELGIAGVIPFLLLLFGCFRLNARTRRILTDSGRPKGFNFYLAMGLDMSLVGLMVSGAFLTVLYYPHLWVILGLSAGLNKAVANQVAAESFETAEAESRPLTPAEAFQGEP